MKRTLLVIISHLGGSLLNFFSRGLSRNTGSEELKDSTSAGEGGGDAKELGNGKKAQVIDYLNLFGRPNICPHYEREQELVTCQNSWKARLLRSLWGTFYQLFQGNRNPLCQFVLCLYNRCLLSFRELGQEVSYHADPSQITGDINA